MNIDNTKLSNSQNLGDHLDMKNDLDNEEDTTILGGLLAMSQTHQDISELDSTKEINNTGINTDSEYKLSSKKKDKNKKIIPINFNFPEIDFTNFKILEPPKMDSQVDLETVPEFAENNYYIQGKMLIKN